MKRQIIPNHIFIETVRGCNAKCVMCPLTNAELESFGAKMSDKNFKKIIDKFAPYVSKINFVSLWGLGEPLLDSGIFEKIKYLKKNNFRNIAIATNADLMDDKKQNELLESGIDSVICSIDGIDKKTHESIRRNTNFENVLKNVQACIKKRDAGGYKTRFLIRMIRQESNYKQWPAYVKYWKKYIDNSKRDDVIAFDVQSLGGILNNKKRILDYSIPCLDVNEKIMIDFDGEITLCCGDIPGKKGKSKIGNVLKEDPIKIFNNEIFAYHREMNAKKLRGFLYLCQKCDLPDIRREKVVTSF
jgi:MoaA/NifB/PqqE/SkfB family radical SAM enzyme